MQCNWVNRFKKENCLTCDSTFCWSEKTDFVHDSARSPTF